MICAKCGTELHPRSLHCWKCGIETPNYTEELKALNQKAEEQRLENLLGTPPEAASPSGKKLIRAYKQTWFGRKLAGWVDENGYTFKNNWPFKPAWKPHWTVDELGYIYVEAGEHRAFVGWIGEDGAVYGRYARPSSGVFSSPENTRFFQPKAGFSPDLVFQVRIDGTVYLQSKRGTKIVGNIEGARDLGTIAGLALMVLSSRGWS